MAEFQTAVGDYFKTRAMKKVLQLVLESLNEHHENGEQYKSAWGEVEIIEDTFLGLKTNRNSSNWFAKVGSESNYIVIAGCQIHYAVRCEKKPHTGEVEEVHADATNVNKVKRNTNIFIAE